MKSLIISAVMAFFSSASFCGDTTIHSLPGSEPRVYMTHLPAGLQFVPHHRGYFHLGSPYANRPMHRSAHPAPVAAGIHSVSISVPGFEKADEEMALTEAPRISVPSFEEADEEIDLHAIQSISLPSFDQADREMLVTEDLRISVPSFDMADHDMMPIESVRISLPDFTAADLDMQVSSTALISLPSFGLADQEVVALMNGSAK